MHDMSPEFRAPGPLPDVRARALREADIPTLGRLLAKDWYQELEPEHAVLVGTDQLLFNLSQAGGAVVATDERGEFLGICLADWGESDPADVALWAGMAARLREQADERGLALRPEPSVETEGHDLLSRVAGERGGENVGELELLYVAAEARGRGLGRRLMEAGLSWLRECGATRYRLVTDDACDWGLYEHLGLLRVGEVTSVSANDPGLRIYAYEGQL